MFEELEGQLLKLAAQLANTTQLLEILLAAEGVAMDRVEQRCWKWLAAGKGQTKGVCEQREYANKGSMRLGIARTALRVCGFLVFPIYSYNLLLNSNLC